MPIKYKFYRKKKLGVMGVRKVYINSRRKQFFKVKGKYHPVYPKTIRRRR